MQENSTERTSLLHGESNSYDGGKSNYDNGSITQNKSESVSIRVPERTGLARFFIVEITLTLFFFTDMPLHLILQKYILDWTKHEFIQRDSLLNITHHLNETFTPCNVNSTDADYMFQQEVQARASMISAVQSVVRGVPAVFSTLVIGSISDRLGRRYAILPPCFGLLMYSIILLIITLVNLPIYYIFIADFIYGSTGLLYGMTMGCSAYVADYTPNERLAIRLGIIGACALFPSMISTQLVALLVEMVGFWKSVLVAVIILLVNMTYVVIFLQESPRNVTVSESLTSSVKRQMHSIIKIIRNNSPSASRYQSVRFILLLSVLFFLHISLAGASLNTFFTMNYPLCWDLRTLGYYTGAALGACAFGSIIIMPLEKLWLSDSLIALISTVSSMLENIYKFLVRNTIMMFLVPVFDLFAIQSHACIRSMVSEIAGKNKQGSIFGLMSSIEVLCSVIGTVLLNNVYASTLYIATGFVFLVVAMSYAVASILLLVHYIIFNKEKAENRNLTVQDVDEPGE